MQTRASRQIDTLLNSFLFERDEAESERLLDGLLSQYAEPIIKIILSHKLRIYHKHIDYARHNEDVEELCADALLQLIKRLQYAKRKLDGAAIRDFQSYVVVTANNAFHKYLRQKYPERCRLKNRLRYVLTHHIRFALWEDSNNELVCGLAAWRNQKKLALHKGLLQQLGDDHRSIELIMGRAADAEHDGLVNLLVALFDLAGGPIELDEVVTFIADSWAIKDQRRQTRISLEEGIRLEERLEAPNFNLAARVEQRIYLQRIWREICELPINQRAALLLNLRDANGRDILTLLAHIRIATVRQIAEALAIPAEEFAELWNELPLNDAAIAMRLGLTQQQVITLRQAARRRLSRRTKDW